MIKDSRIEALQALQESVSTAIKKLDELRGRKKALEEQLLELYKCKTVGQAEKLANEARKDLIALELKFEKQMKAIDAFKEKVDLSILEKE